MATIRFVNPGSPWTDSTGGYRKRSIHPGDDGYPELFELEVAPHTVTAAHAHAEDEVIFLLAGSLHFGATEYTSGSSVLVPKNTLYQFRAGAKGCTYLNFRPRRAEVIPKEDFLAGRRDASAERP